MKAFLSTKTSVRLLLAGAAAVGTAFAATAVAQVAPQQPNSAQGLNLPTDVVILGKIDPAVRKATAIVNGSILTDTDVDQRLALVLSANGGNLPQEEVDRLRLQVLRNMIDEQLQIQEAAANEITVTKPEIDQAFNRVAGNFRRTPADLRTYLTSIGSSERSLRRQIEGELAWRRFLQRRVEPFINVGQEEVQAVMDRLNAAKGAQEYRIGEIFLSSSSDNAAQIKANADRIVQQVRGGGSFVAYARQFSEASTAAVGGDLGWVRAEQLPEELTAVARLMQPGTISDPVPVSGGFSIIALIDTRQVLSVDARDAVLALKQIAISFPPGTSQAQAEPRVSAFATSTRRIQGCGNADEIVRTIEGATVQDNDQVRVRDLPPALQEMMLRMQVGQVTPPIGSPEDGVSVLVLCGRDDPQQAGAPSFDNILAQMEEERVNRRALRYLRDLRRDAVVDYR